MTIRVSTLKNGEVRLRVMTIRHSTLSVSWYQGVYHKVSVEEKWGPWFYEKMNEGDEKDISEKAHYYTWLIAVIVSFVILAAPEIVVILGSTAYKEASYTVVPIVASGFFAFLYTLPVEI